MTEKKILIVGLSDAGKSTYLGALNGELRQDGNFCLRYGGKSSNEDYLNKIVKNTEYTSAYINNAWLPEWAITSFENDYWGYWPSDWTWDSWYWFEAENLNEYCKDVCGILLFINNIQKPVLKENANKAMSQPEEANKETSADQIKLTPNLMTDVTKNLLVVKYLKELIGDVRIVVAVSSWDLLTTFNSIQEYCEIQIAGLYNYVRHNFKHYWFCGVSAQGFAIGSYPINLDELTSTGKRAYIFETAKDFDISKPLKYLIED